MLTQDSKASSHQPPLHTLIIPLHLNAFASHSDVSQYGHINVQGTLSSNKDEREDKTMDPIIKVSQLKKRYQQGDTWITALDTINLELSAGEFVAIHGHSGSGKSTLLNIIGTLEQADSGDITLWDEKVKAGDQKQQQKIRRDNMAFIFQNFNLNPALSAYENVMIPLLLSSLKTKDRSRHALAMLEAVGLQERTHHRPGQLSGGQQQRVAAARALVTQPKLILADEPTANLDSESTEQLMSVLKQLNQSQGTTVLFSTHDERLLKHVDRKIHLVNGQIQATGV